MSESQEPASFETLKAWKEARVLAKTIYGITRDGALAKDFGLAGQMQRAAVSIAGNIAEGYGRGRPAEFNQFLNIATGSLSEPRSHCYVALDAGYINTQMFDHLYAKLDDVARLIAGLRRWNNTRS